MNRNLRDVFVLRDDTKTRHTKNLQKLIIEVYKSFNHLNPEYMGNFM